MILKKQQDPASVNVGSVLLLQVPRTNEKKELAAEQMFASLHGLLTSAQKSLFKKPVHERVSFEIAVKAKRIGFYVWVPDHLKSFVEEQIYAQYPTVHISEVEDYSKDDGAHFTAQLVGELKLSANSALPIKTFPSFEVDPLAAITAALAQFDEDEEAWLQVVLRPASETWHKKSEKFAGGIRNKGASGGSSGIASALWAPPEAKAGGQAAKLAEHETTKASAAEEKSQKLAYDVALRVVYRGHGTTSQAKMRFQAITASFKQFNTTYLNGFKQSYLSADQKMIDLYKRRAFKGTGFICNIEEVASLYHLPHTNVETPNILWANATTAEPPANLPLVSDNNRDEVSPIAVTNFRGHNSMFGMPRSDRGRHIYIIGQTGVGKSGMLELLTISDIYSPYGFAVVDPHGDYAINTLKRIPPERVNDVIYFNPADTNFPIAFNPMEVYDESLKTHTTSELIGVLKRMFESWGPRLEYILRYSLLALLDYPQATMLDITRILTDKKFRAEVLEYVEDPVVRNFWLVEFASWNDKFAAEAVAPVLNKVGAFTANPIVRNIIGQPKSSFSIRKIMDERKILIVNLSRGLIGEDNASLLGALLVTKIQMAAMSRADVSLDERLPFYLYVDEFQNFATDSFATILSEARKYGLNLTVANQYIAQMSLSVKDAVFGNVGSIIGFRMSADDARIMQRYFEPKFLEYDLVHMHNRHFALSMTIDGEKAQAFSATTLNLPDYGDDYSSAIIDNSRKQFAVDRDEIEIFVKDRYLTTEQQKAAAKKAGAPPKPPTPSLEKPEMKEASEGSTKPKAPLSKEDLNKRLAKVATGLKDAPQTDKNTNDTEEKPKKKRRRRRKRKNKDGAQSSPPDGTSNPNDKPQPPEDETVIHLR
ncbi:MAG: type IV secretion system DNA-binding domain-containing protein [Candidatus Saccharibacteria bacterium]|nr:type IV secretion system DNA-binding domain-containing protein [Candidatus Saccharibacteria bacterium]